MFTITPEKGEWYIAVVCGQCERRTLLFYDLNKGESLLVGSYDVTCPNCKREGVFKAVHYQYQFVEQMD
jgi:ribosomal protein S27E